MKLFIEIKAKEILEEGFFQRTSDGNQITSFFILPKQIFKAHRYFKKKYSGKVKIRYGIDFGRIGTFLSFFGRQNDYLFPPKNSSEEEKDHYPFPKAHLWKTRFGFSTAWELAKTINR